MHKARNHPLCTASTSAVGTHKRAQSRPRLPHAQHPSRVRDPEKQRERRPHVSSRGAHKLVPPRIPFTREPPSWRECAATIPNAVCWPFIFPSLFLKKVNRVIQFATVRIVARGVRCAPFARIRLRSGAVPGQIVCPHPAQQCEAVRFWNSAEFGFRIWSYAQQCEAVRFRSQTRNAPLRALAGICQRPNYVGLITFALFAWRAAPSHAET